MSSFLNNPVRNSNIPNTGIQGNPTIHLAVESIAFLMSDTLAINPSIKPVEIITNKKQIY
jgi:hypothetical protein